MSGGRADNSISISELHQSTHVDDGKPIKNTNAASNTLNNWIKKFDFRNIQSINFKLVNVESLIFTLFEELKIHRKNKQDIQIVVNKKSINYGIIVVDTQIKQDIKNEYTLFAKTELKNEKKLDILIYITVKNVIRNNLSQVLKGGEITNNIYNQEGGALLETILLGMLVSFLSKVISSLIKSGVRLFDDMLDIITGERLSNIDNIDDIIDLIVTILSTLASNTAIFELGQLENILSCVSYIFKFILEYIQKNHDIKSPTFDVMIKYSGILFDAIGTIYTFDHTKIGEYIKIIIKNLLKIMFFMLIFTYKDGIQNYVNRFTDLLHKPTSSAQSTEARLDHDSITIKLIDLMFSLGLNTDEIINMFNINDKDNLEIIGKFLDEDGHIIHDKFQETLKFFYDTTQDFTDGVLENMKITYPSISQITEETPIKPSSEKLRLPSGDKGSDPLPVIINSRIKLRLPSGDMGPEIICE